MDLAINRGIIEAWAIAELESIMDANLYRDEPLPVMVLLPKEYDL